MATRPIDDGVTALAIRQSMAAAASGRLAEACAIGERALAQGGDVAALNAMLGMLRGRAGDAMRASEHLATAHNAKRDDPIIAHNLVQALIELERFEDALQILTDALVESDRDGRLRRLRAFIAQCAGQYDIAVGDYEKVVALSAQDWESWNNLGNARRGAGDVEGAVDALRRAVELAPLSPPVRLNLANSLSASGQVEEAEAELKRMIVDFPDDSNPLRELHVLYRQSGRDAEATEAIERAIEVDPTNVELLLGKASHLSKLLMTEESEATYRRVLALDPRHPLGHLGVAVCLDLTNRTEELATIAENAEQQDIDADALNFIRAMDHRRAKRFDQGLAAMEQVPEELESARRCHVMGQLLEGVGRYDDAFASYTEMNRLMREEFPVALDRAKAYREMIRERRDAMTSEWMADWRQEEADDHHRPPVFLYGFPRSGTTLLDTMMMGHPSIDVLEEEPTLQKAFASFASADAVRDASDETIAAARTAYFAYAAEKGTLGPGHLLVDKNPLAINAVPIMHRLFPTAKHILALRHPCDVLLSCYVTNFRMNDGMASFARLDTAAELYDLSFGYFERARSLMDLNIHTIFYERVVEDRDRELRALFDFLELDWHDAVLDHESTAKKRGRIKTASYAQVVEPIYQRSAGRWVKFRRHLEPILPTLKPWIEKFGYEA